jgi:hypothetical protein
MNMNIVLQSLLSGIFFVCRRRAFAGVFYVSAISAEAVVIDTVSVNYWSVFGAFDEGGELRQLTRVYFD